MVGVVSAAFVELVGVLRQQYVRRRNVRSLLATIHRNVEDLDPVADLGVRGSTVGSGDRRRGSGGAIPTYIPGEVDQALDLAFARSGFVLITGNSLAGKSRAAYEAVCRMRPRPYVLVPEDLLALDGLLALDPPLLDTWRPIVVWLGDLRQIVGQLPGEPGSMDRAASENGARLSAAQMTRHLTSPVRRFFFGRRPRVMFLATMPAREFDVLTKGGELITRGAGAPSLSALSRVAQRVDIGDGKGAGWDLQTARRLHPDVDFSAGVGRAFSEVDVLANTYRFGLDEVAEAVVHACVDWHRIGAGDPNEEQIENLVNASLPARIFTEGEIASSLRRVNREIAGGQRLIGRGGASDDPRFHAHGSLIDADEGYGASAISRPVPSSVWQVALACLRAPDLLAVADAAVGRGELDVAERIWEAICSRGVEGVGIDTWAAARLHRGEAYAWVSEERARPDFDAVIELAGAPPQIRAAAHQARGGITVSDGWSAEGEADLTAAIETADAEPETRARGHANRGVLRMGRDDQAAEADFNAALAISGASENPRSHAYAMRGALRFQREEIPQAEADFEAALAFDGSRPFARSIANLGLAEVRAWGGSDRQAEALFERAIAVAGIDLDTRAKVLMSRGTFYYRRDRMDESRADFDLVLAMAGLDSDELAEALVGRARSHERDGGEAGLADCTLVIEMQGVEAALRAEAYLARGRLWEVRDEFEDADRDLATAFECPGGSDAVKETALLSRGIMYYRQGDRMKEAEREFTAAIEFPGADEDSRGTGYYDRGLTRLSLNRPGAAEADFRAALTLRSDTSLKALSVLADLLRSNGRARDEIALYEAVVKLKRRDLTAFAMARLEAHERVVSRRTRRRRGDR